MELIFKGARMQVNKTITELERKKAQKLLDELETTKPEELSDWNIRAQTLLVFIAMRNPDLIFEKD